MAAAGVGYLLLFGRSDEAVATAHLEVGLSGEEVDEGVADVMLHVAGHLMIHLRQSALHHHTFLLTIHRAVLAPHLRIAGIDGHMTERGRIGMAAHQPAQTLLVQGTGIDETHQIAGYFLTEDVGLRLWSGIGLGFTTSSSSHSAKVHNFCDLTKQSKEKNHKNGLQPSLSYLNS